MSSAARAFEQRSAAAVAQIAAELDNGVSAPDASPASPSVAAGGLDFRAAQIAEDAKLAQELQREEYRKQEARAERRRQRRAAAATDQNTSWTDWLMGTTPSNRAAPTNTTSSSTSSSSPARSASSPAGRGGGGARVAQPSTSMFACVAQSISSVMAPQQSQVSGVDSSSLL